MVETEGRHGRQRVKERGPHEQQPDVEMGDLKRVRKSNVRLAGVGKPNREAKVEV